MTHILAAKPAIRALSGATAITALLTAPAMAQNVFELDEIIFSGNLTQVEADRSGASATVITEAELEATEDIRVVDLLRRVPGVSIRTNGPLGTQAALTVRGISQQNIAVRIDGIDVSDPSGTQVAYDFGGLTTSDISRIEIIRGSQSALYGSEAIGGVIDITTRRATADGMTQSVTAEYGSYNTISGSYSFSNRGAGHETNVTLSHVSSDGFSAADEDNGNTEADGFTSNRISFSGRYDIGDALVLDASAFLDQAEFDYDETQSCPAASATVCDGFPDDVTERDQTGARLALTYDTGTWDHVGEISYLLSDRRLSGSNAFGGFDFRYEGERHQFGYRAIGDLGGNGTLVLGLEQVIESYSDRIETDFPPVTTQSFETTITSAFAEYSFAPSDMLDIAATIRYDDHSQFGDFVTGRLSAAYRPQDDLIIRANLANGYRAPSNYELYDGFAGDATLQPETSVSFDLGIEQRFADRGFVSATVFWIEAEDIIDYSFTSFNYVQREGTATRQGVELAGGWGFDSGLSVEGSYTFTDSRANVTIDSSGWAVAVPQHAISATVGGDIRPDLSLFVTGTHQAGRPGLDDFTTFDATLAFGLTDDIDLYVRADNLLDEAYQTVPGYGTSDRAFYVGLRASF